jgi:ribosomal protein S18 acetylase RimI-like enzyme
MSPTVLAVMPAQAYATYLEAASAAYAKDNVDAGRWPAEGALARARADFEASLPQGLSTPDHYLFEIRAGEDGPCVGVLWFAVEERHGLREAFVYDLEVWPEWQRQGHAERAMRALEEQMPALGLSRIGLHVFGHNAGAQALYERLGYRVTGLNMAKRLEI